MKCKKCGQELEIGVKFCPNCGEDCVSQDTGIPVKESVDKTKSAINDFGENMQKKEVEISGKKFNMLEVLTFGSGILAIISWWRWYYLHCFSCCCIDFILSS